MTSEDGYRFTGAVFGADSKKVIDRERSPRGIAGWPPYRNVL
jgi:hypothetical protein